MPMFDKGDRGFSQQIEGIKTDLVIFAHTKNRHSLSKLRRVSVVLTPKLEKAFVKITPPVYTGIVPDEKPLPFKTLRALEGSKLEFRLQSNRPLSAGRIEIIKAADDIKPVTAFVEGLEINGRLVMVYSKDGLNDVSNAKGCCCCGGNMIVESVAVNVNVFTYSLLY